MSESWLLPSLMTAPEIGLTSALFIPALTAIVLLVWDQINHERVAAGGVALTGIISLGLLASSLSNANPSINGGEFAPNIPIAFEVDLLGGILGVIVTGAVLAGILAMSRYQHHRKSPMRRRTVAAMLATTAAALIVVYAGNLFILFIGLEVLTIVTYPLIVTEERTVTRRAGYTYLAFLFTAGLSFLIGMRVLYAEIGTLTFMSDGIPELEALAVSDPWIARAAFGLLLIGIATKAALIPLHSWFIRARMVPTPILGVIFAIIVLKIGSFTLARVILNVFGLETATVLELGPPLLAFGLLTVLIAGLLAIGSARLLDRLLYLTLTGGALSFVAFGTIRDYWMHWGIGFFPIHAGVLLVAFIGFSQLEVADDHEDVRLGTIVGWLFVGVMVLVWLVGLMTFWFGSANLRGVIVILGLTAAIVAHILALWPVLIDPYLVYHPRRTMDDRLVIPPGAGVILTVARSLHQVKVYLASEAERISVGAMRGIRAPGEALEMILPPRLESRYRIHRRHRLGEMGAKLGIEGSLYILALVLAVGLFIGLM